MFRFKAVSLFAVLLSAAAASASPVAFSLQNGAFSSGATLSGTVVIDPATGALVSTNLTYTRNGMTLPFDQPFYAQSTIPAAYNVYFPLQ